MCHLDISVTNRLSTQCLVTKVKTRSAEVPSPEELSDPDAGKGARGWAGPATLLQGPSQPIRQEPRGVLRLWLGLQEGRARHYSLNDN